MRNLDPILTHLAERAAEMTAIGWLNCALALGGALVALGAVDRMKRCTDPRIAVAFVTVGAGLLGQAGAYFAPAQWAPGFDTLLFGGIAALLIGTRRHTVWIHPRWMPLLSSTASMVTWVVFFGTVRA